MIPIQDQGEYWYRWKPANAESGVYDDIAEAIDAFEPVDHPAGHAAAEWLKNSALDDYPSTATWIAYRNQRVEGYFAMCSGEVLLYGRHRKKKLVRKGRRREHVLHPPATGKSDHLDVQTQARIDHWANHPAARGIHSNASWGAAGKHRPCDRSL